MNLIALAGRKESGKTTLASLAEAAGFTRVSFGLFIKEILAAWQGITVEEFNRLKEARVMFPIEKSDCEFFGKQTGIPAEKFVEVLISPGCTMTMRSPRELIQLVATDVIRKHDPDWHVVRARNEILKHENVIVDDLRFQNEKKMLEDLNAEMFFVIRPDKLDGISNHESETSIRWREIKNRIVTGRRIAKSKAEFSYYLLSSLAGDEAGKAEALDMMSNLSAELTAPYYACPVERVGLFNGTLDDVDHVIAAPKRECVLVHYKDGWTEQVFHPMLIEDLKLLM